MTKRTDIHREGAIIPSNYEWRVSYSLPTTFMGYPMPAINVDKVLELQQQHPKASHGGLGHCTLCGARYGYGDVWQHKETGELIHVGYDCADKVGFVAEREEYEGIRLAVVEQIKAKIKLAKLCHDDEDLMEAFTFGKHPIILDIKAKLFKYKSISEKQIAFVKKLRHEEIEDAVTLPTLDVAKPALEWVDVKGNTYPVRQQLKELGARWDGYAKVWKVRADKAEAANAIVNPPKPAAPAVVEPEIVIQF